jgi:molybdate transport system substrate-binding protein
LRAKVLMLLLLLLTGSTVHAATLRIAAAADLQPVLTQALIPLFERQTGARVIPTFGATRLLATQVQSGLPVDVFISADQATTAKLLSEGLLTAGSIHAYAIGRLVIWSRREAAHHPRRLQDLASPAYGRIAIANPALAPYGVAAVQSLSHAGLTAAVASRLVKAENISQCLQYAQTGNAAVALTALSLVIGDRADPYVIVPDDLHAPIVQSLGLVKGSAQPTLARRLIAFLTGPSAAPLWKHYGYGLPSR